jgi:eukaryotic-like serine/threonine-protein kinase
MESLRASDPPRIGPYGLVGRLGAGGMGQVYLGRSAGGRLVAVKVIRPELAGEPGFQARFAREVAAARTVSGLFTAAVVDADVSGPVPWLATAYVAGPSLADAVGGQGPLPVTSVLALAAGLVEGLAAIHAAGVVHRDLKPENVLLADDGPRLIDFGISRAAQTSRLTQTGMVLGSPGFMSPEQAEGGAVGPASDVFSLGAVLTFAATGEGPFGTGSAPALVYRAIHRPPETSRLAGQIRPLVERCLAKDPRQRPATTDLLAELGAGRPTSTVLAELGVGGPAGTMLAGPSAAAVTRAPADPRSPSPGAGSAGPPTATVARSWALPTAASFPAPPGAGTSRPARGRPRGPLWALFAAGLIAAAAAAFVVPRAIGDAPASQAQRTTAARNALSPARPSPSTTPMPVPPSPVTMAGSPGPAPTGSAPSSPSAFPAPIPSATMPTPAPTTPAAPTPTPAATPTPTMTTPAPAATPMPTASG